MQETKLRIKTTIKRIRFCGIKYLTAKGRIEETNVTKNIFSNTCLIYSLADKVISSLTKNNLTKIRTK